MAHGAKAETASHIDASRAREPTNGRALMGPPCWGFPGSLDPLGSVSTRLRPPSRLRRCGEASSRWPFGYFPNVNLAATMALRGSTNTVG